MAGQADRADSGPPRQIFTLAIAVGCILAAYIFMGAPGISGTPLAAFLPKIDPQMGWLPAFHLLASAGALAGGAWLTGVLRGMGRPGAIPLALFALFQFALLLCALSNLALAAGGIRIGGMDGALGALLVIPAFAALRLHSELYMAVLRLTSWVRAVNASDHSPGIGGGLIALTVASNLIPLAFCFQAVTTHSGAVMAALFRRAAADPTLYGQAIWSQIAAVSTQEAWLALIAAGVSGLLGLFWAVSRASDLSRIAAAERSAGSLSAAQLHFVDDALPAAVHAVRSRASANRFVAWSFFWVVLAAPVLLMTAYAAAMWFGVLQEAHALSWTTNAASDLTPFASGEAGWARAAIPVALVLFVLLMNAPTADLFLRGARFDRMAFGQPLEPILRAKLLAAVQAGEHGPNQSFDADRFADLATRQHFWGRAVIVLSSAAVAAAIGFWDVARGVAFTGDGLIVQEHFFAPAKLIRFHEVQAVAIDCRIGPWGGKPVYELSLPGGRVVDMVGTAPLSERLDQYLAVDERLQFSGVGYAYPPGDLEPCLQAIQQQYNSVIAAGTARLLHVLD